VGEPLGISTATSKTRPRKAAHEFSDRRRSDLVVQPPQHLAGGTGLVVLDEAQHGNMLERIVKSSAFHVLDDFLFKKLEILQVVSVNCCRCSFRRSSMVTDSFKKRPVKFVSEELEIQIKFNGSFYKIIELRMIGAVEQLPGEDNIIRKSY